MEMEPKKTHTLLRLDETCLRLSPHHSRLPRLVDMSVSHLCTTEEKPKRSLSLPSLRVLAHAPREIGETGCKAGDMDINDKNHDREKGEPTAEESANGPPPHQLSHVPTQCRWNLSNGEYREADHVQFPPPKSLTQWR